MSFPISAHQPHGGQLPLPRLRVRHTSGDEPHHGGSSLVNPRYHPQSDTQSKTSASQTPGDFSRRDDRRVDLLSNEVASLFPGRAPDPSRHQHPAARVSGRRDVTRNTIGPLPVEELPEADLLAAIKALAVREENPKVARIAHSRMVQDRGEPIRSFAARLRGQAEVCRFLKKCSGCDIISNQGEERVADQLCIGLADAEIQEDLLKNTNQSMTVEETIRFVEVRVGGDHGHAHNSECDR